MAEKKDFPVFRVGIVTLSDKGYQGEREDKSGPKIKELLPAEQYEVVSMRLLPDERAMIEEELIRLSDLERCDRIRRLRAEGRRLARGRTPVSARTRWRAWK